MNEIQQIIEDIKALKIQGATNVAKACLEGIKIFANSYQGKNPEEFINEIKVIAWKLANARPTEPLARNLVRDVLSKIPENQSLDYIRDTIIEDAIMTVYQILERAKAEIVRNGTDLLIESDALLTHCHSSTAEQILENVFRRAPKLKVYATETRPLFQGHITVQHLLEKGIETVMIVDSAAPMFILSEKQPDVDAVIIGCDEIMEDGGVINKIGSLQIALACDYGEKPLYVATTLLKLDLSVKKSVPQIEFRSGKEVWQDAPEDLTVINPAFELIPQSLITGLITEGGIIIPQEVEKTAEEIYPWLRIGK